MTRSFIRNFFGLRSDVGINFHIGDFVFRRLLFQNRGVKWPVHYTTTIRCPQNIKKGIGCYPGDSPGVYIDAVHGLEVGDYVNMGPHVTIITANHDLIDNDKTQPSPPVKIGGFSWLGAKSIILPGVELGRFTIVGAGAVVTKSFKEGYQVLAGNPAKVIRQLNQEECEKFASTKIK